MVYKGRKKMALQVGPDHRELRKRDKTAPESDPEPKKLRRSCGFESHFLSSIVCLFQLILKICVAETILGS